MEDTEGERVADREKDVSVIDMDIDDHQNEPTNKSPKEDMKEFRRKLAVILLKTELNKLKGSPIYYEPDNEEKNLILMLSSWMIESTAVTEAALAFARDLDSQVQPDIQALAALLRSWTEIERNISSCNLGLNIVFHSSNVARSWLMHVDDVVG
ncbi:hypothetical protein D1007_11478 [Hordeum vulgare]|nr:hypothetical protein D1007_11478 [Hordeum vulgare]